jgi:hypothetical protein
LVGRISVLSAVQWLEDWQSFFSNSFTCRSRNKVVAFSAGQRPQAYARTVDWCYDKSCRHRWQLSRTGEEILCEENNMISRFFLMFLLSCTSCWVNAGCVEGALTKTKFNRLNNHTIALTGGYGEAIVIRTSCVIKRKSHIEILKDSFCDLDKAVLYIDGENCDAEQVSTGAKMNEGRAFDEEEWEHVPD